MKHSFIVFCLMLSTVVIGQNTWNKTTSNSNDDIVFVTSRLPITHQLFNIQIDNLRRELEDAPLRFTTTLEETETIVSFPNREGKFQAFKILEAPMMKPELAAQFRMIKTYVGQGIDDPTAMLYMSIGTDGLHVMIRAAGKSALFIDPYTRNREKYILYSKSDLPQIDGFNCEFEQEETLQGHSEISPSERNITDGKMREYNLAVATTIEYSAYHLTNQGVSGGASTAVKKAAVLSAITNTINRVKGIYETELGVTFVLNANQNDIIFIDSDNFSNDDANVLIDESQVEIDNVIGNANYDIGHTFSTGGGGLASLGGICTVDGFGAFSRKAQAITGSSNPIGDSYDVDFVAHEMGHHFGANHSYNGSGVGSCNTSNAGTAAEPGSGTTIMAYAGICGSLNVQSNSDAYFHIVSLQEINDRLSNTGNFTHPFYIQCSTDVNTGNQEPVANAGTPYTIPKGTAFVLYGSANDPDGDAITYCWDQIDMEQPNVYPLVSTTTTGPLYRSLTPTTSSNRFMPAFETVYNGSLESTWEVTPTVGRNLNFSLTARDNRVDGGQNTSDEVLITVSSVAGPFSVTSQGTSETWSTGESKTITWNVAGTTANDVNVANVEITLVDETGTVLSTLAASTANDGSHNITVPNIVSDDVRVRVSGVGHIFYALNSAIIAINTAPGYCSTECASTGSTQFVDGTTLVNFNTINNASTGAPAYSDYKAMSTDVVRGQSYNLTINVNTDGNFTEVTKVWIDWNRNCTLDDAGEEYDLGTASSTADGPTSNSPLSIMVPVLAELGETRMRVSSAYNGGGFIPTSCSNAFLGEVEDYTINIVETLPIELTYFQAKIVEEKAIQLNWQTAIEINNAGFELERSTDGRSFQSITWITGNGTSHEQNNYHFVDNTVISNQFYYYRLKQIDHEGTFSYSLVQAAIIRDNDIQISIYPNPVSDRIYINTREEAVIQNDLIFQLVDPLGREVLSRPINQKEASISIEHISQGVYFYRVMDGSRVVKSDKILVR